MEAQPGIVLKNKPHFTDCVKWNDDGQVLFCVGSRVHILTPILSGLSSKKDNYTHVGLDLPPIEKSMDSSLIVDSNQIQTSFLLNEEGFRCANWSPISLSRSQSCFLVVVTTKHRVLIYQSSPKDPMNSDWQLYVDITDKIKENAIQHEHATKINPYHTLYACWSERLIPDPLATTPALLALSNKAGDVMIWTYSTNADFEYTALWTPHKSFVNLVEWTSWTRMTDNTSVAFVISSSTDGTVAISSVTVEYSVNDKRQTEILGVQAEVKYQWFEKDTIITKLIKAHTTEEKQIKIAISKGTTIRFICLDIASDGGLSPQSDWMWYDLENSACGLTGGSWINDNEFRCYTVEGEGLQIHVDTNIHQVEQTHTALNARLVQKYKQQWMEEQMKATDDALIGASDAHPYIWGAADSVHHLFTAIYLTMRPTVDMHYIREVANESSVIFILHSDRGANFHRLYEVIDEYVNDVDLFFTKPFRGPMREMLEYIVNEDDITSFQAWISKLLDHLNDPQILVNEGITRSIFSEPSTTAARLLINAEIEFQNFGSATFKRDIKAAFELARDFVQINYTRNILRYASQLPEEQLRNLTEDDTLVLLLLADSSLNMGNGDLIKEALNVYLALQDKFPLLSLQDEIEYTTNYNVEKPEAAIFRAREKCPVCDEYVNFIEYTLFAQCGAGHFWELCCMTKKVLSTPNTRKCITCGAKSLQPGENGFLTDAILTNCYKCIFCGGGLMQ